MNKGKGKRWVNFYFEEVMIVSRKLVMWSFVENEQSWKVRDEDEEKLDLDVTTDDQ